MGGFGKKYILKFDPRTELLLLLLANVVAFTQHSLWVEITWVVLMLLCLFSVAAKSRRQAGCPLWALPAPAVLCFPKRAENYSQQLYHSGFLWEKGFPMLNRGNPDITENICQGAYGSPGQVSYSSRADYSPVGNHPLFSRFKGRSGIHKGCHETA